MNDQPVNGDDPDIQAEQKKQIWMILLVMLASGCVGVMIVISLIWFFRSFLLP